MSKKIESPKPTPDDILRAAIDFLKPPLESVKIRESQCLKLEELIQVKESELQQLETDADVFDSSAIREISEIRTLIELARTKHEQLVRSNDDFANLRQGFIGLKEPMQGVLRPVYDKFVADAIAPILHLFDSLERARLCAREFTAVQSATAILRCSWTTADRDSIVAECQRQIDFAERLLEGHDPFAELLKK